jgi:hypothetical protein
MKTALTTLAFGKKAILESQTNLANQSEKYFSNLYFYNEHTIDKDFLDKNKEIFSYSRGWGFWLWKPFIIKKTMESMKDGDILLYLDCGCELNNNKKDELLHCINIVKQDKIMGTPTRVENDREWNKMDLIVKMNMNNTQLDTRQRQTGAILFLVCEETRKFADEWYTIGCDYHNIDDSPSIKQNFQHFVEHRHDQSIFSLLTKKYNLYSSVNLKGIYYIRNRNGKSELSNKYLLMEYDYINH